MSKIITITFSPSIDKSANVSEIKSDIKMHCSNLNIEPGGGGINVARVIGRLGGDVTAIFPSGGYAGMRFNDLLKEEKVAFINIDTKNETRENLVVFDESSNQEFRFGMPSNEIFEIEIENILSTIKNLSYLDFIIVSGSLPASIPFSIFGKIAAIAKSKNAKLIVDTSGEALKHALNEGLYLLKPNREELGKLLKIKDLRIEDIEATAKTLIQKKQCEIIVVSLGANGAMLVSKDEVILIKPPKVEVKNTVGAGDSMVAGIVFGLSNNLPLRDCLQYGIACGTATTMNVGSSLCEKNEVEALLEIIKKTNL